MADAALRERLRGMLRFLDVAAPDMHNRYVDLIENAASSEELEQVQQALMRDLRTR